MKESIRIRANAMREINDICMQGAIVVFGSTYMSKFPLYELINKCNFENAIYNRSIEGLTVSEALEIVKDCVINIFPSKIFISLGEEDQNDPNVVENYTRLVSYIRRYLPESSLYLIGLTGDSQYARDFNQSIMKLCENKKVKYIELVSKQVPDTVLYRARFKQLSCFFRSLPLNAGDVFAIADI